MMRTQKTLAEEDRSPAIPKPLDELSAGELERKRQIGSIASQVFHSLTSRFLGEGFEWSLPVIFAKSTDPLWPDPGASIEKRIEIEIYDETVRTMLSMIVHKMVASSLSYPKFFALSPNVRIEKRERKNTGWHTYEFTQLDFEVRAASSRDIFTLIEKIVRSLINDLKQTAREPLTSLGRFDILVTPQSPFKVFDREELEQTYGRDWESGLSREIKEPAWVTNIPREFYDFQDFETGKWDNYDLFLPEYGEVLSGSRREWEYGKITTKMNRDGVDQGNFKLLLRMAEDGRLKPSAGAGIGLERLITWIVGATHIGEVQPFPKIPGIVNEL